MLKSGRRIRASSIVDSIENIAFLPLGLALGKGV